MTIEQFYDKIGADYAEVLSRLGSESLIKRIALRFLSDPTFRELTEGFEEKDAEKAFRAAHTLKGVCSNLGFNRLQVPAFDLTEKLRGRTFDVPGTEELYNEVKKEYLFLTEALAEVQ